MNRFAGKTALVTGASRGLGADIARALGAEGAYVGVHYKRSEGKAQAVLDGIREAGGNGETVGFDVRDMAAVQAGLKAFCAGRERLDLLVNNAAIVADEPFLLSRPDNWRDVVDTNLHGVYNLCRAACRPMMAAGGGIIVNVASAAGLGGAPNQSSYSASKAAVIALTRTLAKELAPRGIRVNAVAPGMIDAGMTLRTPKPEQDKVVARVPVGRMGRAEEVTAAVLFLASDAAGYVVGHTLVVDGGLTA